MTVLHTRVEKLERLLGDRGVPSDQEFQDANALLQQWAKAGLLISLAKVTGRVPDPEAVAFDEAAKADPRFAAAEDVVKRYREAKGYPRITAQRIEQFSAQIKDALARVASFKQSR